MDDLLELIQGISPMNHAKRAAGQAWCDRLAKPPGALGQLELIYARLYALFDGIIDLEKKIVLVYVADNGIVEEQVSANPQETTYIVAQNMLAGQTGLCAISRHVGSDLCVVDIGCKRDIYPSVEDKVMPGTKNFRHQAAMSRDEAIKAIMVGYRRTCALMEEGYCLFGTGEMGIGNTTTSAAVISVLLDKDPFEVTGYGAGLTEDSKHHKAMIIQEAIAHHAPYEDVLDVVAKVGGLDMLGMVGTYLACARHSYPCVVDGLISATGLLIASRLAPAVLDYAFASHLSTEPGYAMICQELGLQPMLQLGMRLGEGSGCPLAFFIMENAVYTMEHMPTFAQGHLNPDDYVDIR
ncbi:nicotinate-nucleotide--dimethylbenzimidazole phosphoribosyltransferase [Streptococcus ovuberis]|uniref:Nicotinate-nucleotide--dimethylbenzimidazole phosphoribosyltransferase n=1 Tax=Streptococcus ovuberis TaxID=1936207 RepID=A0A7X6S2K0_9STRE|nr:nicotinate-nucleotide--dimethylbenzimidazole phosphoribosyltransferase [Streptococcus ovuberis]NKZ21331.1 nicotinate-nucleotide--dimethylbenzimidazole phosphoribosyltransferase [Streptococcus ovuberis]